MYASLFMVLGERAAGGERRLEVKMFERGHKRMKMGSKSYNVLQRVMWNNKTLFDLMYYLFSLKLTPYVTKAA